MLTQVLKVRKYARKNPMGFTLDTETMQPISSGFSVAKIETQNSFGLMGLIKVLIHNRRNKNTIVGGWLDTETNRYYFDSVLIFDNAKDAIESGISNKQIAIFDLNKLEEIRL